MCVIDMLNLREIVEFNLFYEVENKNFLWFLNFIVLFKLLIGGLGKSVENLLEEEFFILIISNLI